MGVPCVSTLIAGIPELIRNEVDGLLVPASDLDALTEALARLVDSRELRLRLATSARARVIELYDLGGTWRRLGVFSGEDWVATNSSSFETVREGLRWLGKLVLSQVSNARPGGPGVVWSSGRTPALTS